MLNVKLGCDGGEDVKFAGVGERKPYLLLMSYDLPSDHLD
jgi:hypothetical protein